MTVIRPLLAALALLVVLGSQATTAGAATVNCSAFPSQAAAQAAYRANPVGLANLDRDRDGIACEDNPAPFDRTPVNLAAVNTASAARTAPTTGAASATQAVPAPPKTGDGSSQSGSPLGWTAPGLFAAMLVGLGTAAGVVVGRSRAARLRRRD
jgi:Excalibur calcium-binding domain